jgi:hypothetical protein
MFKISAKLSWKTCLVYLNDIIILAKPFEEQIKHLEEVLHILKQSNVELNSKKCRFCQKRVTYIEHVISEDGVSTGPEKPKAVSEWPVPKNVTEARSYLGLCYYYRKFIYHFANIARPLHKLTQNSQSFVWTVECKMASNYNLT